MDLIPDSATHDSGAAAPDSRQGPPLAGRIRDAILSGRFAPGQRLVEAELTGEYGISRGPLREALRQLSAEGLVELVPNRGALVRRLTRTETLELFGIRTELEAMAGRLAAARMGDAAVRAGFAAEAAEVFEERPRFSTADYTRENNRFHGAILRASGNSQLLRLHSGMQMGLIMSQVREALPSEIVAASLNEHRQIAQAILAADAAAADEALRAHLTRAIDYMRSMPDRVFRAAP